MSSLNLKGKALLLAILVTVLQPPPPSREAW